MRVGWGLLALTLAACGDGSAEAGGRCSNIGVSTCSFGQGEALLCVDRTWVQVEACDTMSGETCVVAAGEALCSFGGEACDEEGATRCGDPFTLLRCDGQAWELDSDCFPGTCETEAGESRCAG